MEPTAQIETWKHSGFKPNISINAIKYKLLNASRQRFSDDYK